MSEWKVTKDEKRKLSVMISEDQAQTLDQMKELIAAESGIEKVSDSQAFEKVIKIASNNSVFKRFIKQKKEGLTRN